MAENNFPLEQMTAHFQEVLRKAPGILGNDAVNFFLDRFRNQAWMGSSREPWAQRKTNLKKGRSILIQSGRLKRSIRVTSLSSLTATIGSDVPYAKAHNEGFKGSVKQNVKPFSRKTKKGIQPVKGFSRTINQNIPKRQFMGWNSPVLTDKLKQHFQKMLLENLPNNP